MFEHTLRERLGMNTTKEYFMLDEQTLRTEIQAVLAPEAKKVFHIEEMRRKESWRPSEVECLFGISVSQLCVLRKERRGPQFWQDNPCGAVLYPAKEFRRWLENNMTKTRE